MAGVGDEITDRGIGDGLSGWPAPRMVWSTFATPVQLGPEHLRNPVFLQRTSQVIRLEVTLRQLDRKILRPLKHRGRRLPEPRVHTATFLGSFPVRRQQPPFCTPGEAGLDIVALPKDHFFVSCPFR
uniref:Uncharacterized protein n=1 Tax=Rhodococcus sp. NS1 TaxID=402236 RepID=A0A097SQ20_9NOCA|nr:hypothetical protein LRS1606.186 [Rhodococcus sp. NS1]